MMNLITLSETLKSWCLENIKFSQEVPDDIHTDAIINDIKLIYAKNSSNFLINKGIEDYLIILTLHEILSHIHPDDLSDRIKNYLESGKIQEDLDIINIFMLLFDYSSYLPIPDTDIENIRKLQYNIPLSNRSSNNLPSLLYFSTLELQNEVINKSDNLKSWQILFDNIDDEHSIGIRSVLHEVDDNEITNYPKQVSVIIHNDLFPIYSTPIFLNEKVFSCFHVMKFKDFMHYIFSGEKLSCEICNGYFIDYFPALFFDHQLPNYKETFLENKQIFNSIMIRSVITRNIYLLNPEGIISMNNKRLENLSSNVIQDAIGIRNEYDQRKGVVEFIGMDELVKILIAEYNPLINELFVKISNDIPELKFVIIPHFPENGLVYFDNILGPFSIGDKSVKIESKYLYKNSYVVLLNNKIVLDSKQILFIVNENKMIDEEELIKDFVINAHIPLNKVKRFLQQFNAMEKGLLITIMSYMQFYERSDCIDPLVSKIMGIINNIVDSKNNYYLSTITASEEFSSGNLLADELMGYFPQKTRMKRIGVENLSDLKSEDIVFIVDDMTGTGSQFVDHYNIKSGDKWQCRIFFLSYYMYEEGRRNIKENTSASPGWIKLVTDDNKITSEGNIFLEDGINEVTDLFRHHGSKEYYLGYKKFGGSLIINRHRVSNLIPDVFWKKRKNWISLFQRPI